MTWMSTSALGVIRARPGSRPVVPSRLLGTLLFVFVELMFFSALFSAYFVIKRGRPWELPGSAHLHQAAGGFNTLVLLASAGCLVAAVRALGRGLRDRNWIARAFVLGAFFTAFQAYMASQLVAEGVTMTSSIFGACYFLLVGAHLVHVILGLLAMGWAWFRMPKIVDATVIQSFMVFWLFVVGIWPVIYAEIYF